MVHVVHLRPADGLEPAELFGHRDVLLNGGRDPVLRVEFGDAAIHALGRGAVVGEDVDDQGVVADALSLELVDQPAHLDVGVLQETGIHLHQALLEGAFVLREYPPMQACLPGAAHSFVSAGIQPMAFLALENPLLVGVPAVTELALVLCPPIPRRHGGGRERRPASTTSGRDGRG